MAELIPSDGPHRGKDLVGLVFGKWTVSSFAGWHKYRNGARHELAWHCVCECGKESVLSGTSLKNGESKSCGCWVPELIRAEKKTHGEAAAWCRTPLYRRWADMWSRCTNPKTKRWEDYGGRGISVCEEWKSFERFRDDMGPTFHPSLSIDRIDNDGNYCKENCHWTTQKNQSRNKSSNRIIEINGSKKTLAEWCEIQSLDYYMVWKRLRRGWPPEKALQFMSDYDA